MRYAKVNFIKGIALAEAIRFETSLPHGKGKQEVGVEVPIATLIRLGEILKHTKAPGHAAWHLENPDSPLPCSSCETWLPDAGRTA